MNPEKIETLRKNAIKNIEFEKGKYVGSERIETLQAYDNILNLIQYISTLKSENEKLKDQINSGYRGNN